MWSAWCTCCANRCLGETSVGVGQWGKGGEGAWQCNNKSLILHVLGVAVKLFP